MTPPFARNRFILALGLAATLTGFTAAAVAADHSIAEFGAVGDRQTLNTAAIQRTIDAAASEGGGTVEIPRGVFRSGSIFLKSGVQLHLDDGAVLLGSNAIADYPMRRTRIEGHFQIWRMALVNAEGLHRVRISGPGKFDGNGILFWAAFWQRRKENPQCTNLEVERPRLMYFADCSDLQIKDASLRDSGFWNLHLYRCHDVLLEGLRIDAPATGPIRAPSSDGVDIDSSQRVTIRRCHIAVDDDNIALKGTKGPFAEHDPDSPPVENILVEDSEFGSGNGVITCGSEATVVRNVTVRNVRIIGETKLLNLKLRGDTPQHYEHILVDGVKLEGDGTILEMLPWTQFFDLKGQPAPGHVVDDIIIRNVTGRGRAFGEIKAGPLDQIRHITLQNIQVTLAHGQFRSTPVEHLVLDHVVVNGAPVTAP
ncbi:MAG TPA: glycosyl hydrolase family 28 protein [Opitutaceae bacterium]|jgi:polygalacturonase